MVIWATPSFVHVVCTCPLPPTLKIWSRWILYYPVKKAAAMTTDLTATTHAATLDWWWFCVPLELNRDLKVKNYCDRRIFRRSKRSFFMRWTWVFVLIDIWYSKHAYFLSRLELINLVGKRCINKGHEVRDDFQQELSLKFHFVHNHPGNDQNSRNWNRGKVGR